MAKCSRCKRESKKLVKRSGAVYCPMCLKIYQAASGRR